MKTDTAQGRTYTIDGYDKPFASVTTVLNCASKPFLYAWYGKVGNAEAKRISDESKEIGSKVHTYIEQRLGNVPTDKLPENCLQAGLNADSFLEAIESCSKDCLGEETVHSAKYGFAGTLDRLMYVNGKLTLLDWKTSNQINDEYIIQVNAYYQALTEMQKDGKIELPGKIEQVGIIRLDKKKEFDYDKDVVLQKPNKKAFKAFLGLLDYYNNKDFNKKEK